MSSLNIPLLDDWQNAANQALAFSEAWEDWVEKRIRLLDAIIKANDALSIAQAKLDQLENKWANRADKEVPGWRSLFGGETTDKQINADRFKELWAELEAQRIVANAEIVKRRTALNTLIAKLQGAQTEQLEELKRRFPNWQMLLENGNSE